MKIYSFQNCLNYYFIEDILLKIFYKKNQEDDRNFIYFDLYFKYFLYIFRSNRGFFSIDISFIS